MDRYVISINCHYISLISKHRFTVESLRAWMDANCVSAYSEMSNEHMWRRRHRATRMSWRTLRMWRRVVGVGPRKLRNLLLYFPRLFSQSLMNCFLQPKWLAAFAKEFEMVTHEVAAEFFALSCTLVGS